LSVQAWRAVAISALQVAAAHNCRCACAASRQAFHAGTHAATHGRALIPGPGIDSAPAGAPKAQHTNATAAITTNLGFILSSS
jgi:hypothetical protein